MLFGILIFATIILKEHTLTRYFTMTIFRTVAAVVAALFSCIATCSAADIVWFDGQHPVDYSVESKAAPVVVTALDMFAGDMLQVTGKRPVAKQRNATIRLFEIDRMSRSAQASLAKLGVPVAEVANSQDAFSINIHNGQIIIAGNNGRGVAYGLLEMSRNAGVSPWVWWGDVVPERKQRLSLAADYATLQSPSVEYRGIFINDEDWSLRPWSFQTYEPSDEWGNIGPKTYKKIFQLLLRLRANAIWPAMHEGTSGFFTVPGNKEMADSCGILIGSSHCEPLLRNNVAEWDHKQRGAYNYITNREQVKQYWAERLKEIKGSEELFTIGMRGIHDGSMEGVKTRQEKLDGLQQVIDDQRELIRQYYSKDVEKVPQVFIPYKEVLEILESGLRVPDDVMLMWCDDNYGYMTRLSDAEQQKRSGGGGVYYHLSYWGRPHDVLWLTTMQPGLVYSEMKAAYDHNARRLWIVNVHDPKVAAYDLSLFLDMAWNIESIRPDNLQQHLQGWLAQQFGADAAACLLPAMTDFYRLNGIRRPEFMGWTQVELDKRVAPRGRSQVIDTEFTNEFGDELSRYLGDYDAVRQTVDDVEKMIRPELRDAYYAAIKYPVHSARNMAVKMLEAQRARSCFMGQSNPSMESRQQHALPYAQRSMAAYREIQQMTDYYNNTMAGGKWRHSMTYVPRDLPVFFSPSLPVLPTDAELQSTAYPQVPLPVGDNFVARNAADWQSATPGAQRIQMLGHSMNAVSLPKDGKLTYEFTAPTDGEATLLTALIPTQPNDKGDLRYSVSIDGGEPTTFSLKEKYRSEEWKRNVMRGQARRTQTVNLSRGKHTLTITALDDHVIVDQWLVDFKSGRKFYVIPVR